MALMRMAALQAALGAQGGASDDGAPSALFRRGSSFNPSDMPPRELLAENMVDVLRDLAIQMGAVYDDSGVARGSYDAFGEDSEYDELDEDSGGWGRARDESIPEGRESQEEAFDRESVDEKGGEKGEGGEGEVGGTDEQSGEAGGEQGDTAAGSLL